MEDYTFLCIRTDGSIPAIDIQACRDEAEARGRLPVLFREHVSAEVIEIWVGPRRVTEARRAA